LPITSKAAKRRFGFLSLSKKTKKRGIRYILLGANVAVLIGVTIFMVQGRHTSGDTSKQAAFSVNNTTATNPLDQLSSSDIAVNIAQTSRLPEVQAVRNNADSINAQLSITSTDQKVVAKPQVIATGQKSRKDIQKYVTKDGDTIGGIAAKFGVTSDTIRWSNGLTGDNVAAGKELLISPVNGIVYKVNVGDTVDALAAKYSANKELLIAMNDAEVGLPVGQYIIIPDGSLPTTRARALGGVSGFSFGLGAQYSGNGYDFGYCTWYAADRRIKAGRPLPSNLGNASTWKSLAQQAGLSVGSTPAAGAVIWFPPRDYYGHVGYVESVDSNGTVHIAEMNVVAWGKTSYRDIPAGEAASYSYIY
jgi:LysM repeat protein